MEIGALPCEGVMAGAANQKTVSVCAFTIHDIDKTMNNNMIRLFNTIGCNSEI